MIPAAVHGKAQYTFHETIYSSNYATGKFSIRLVPNLTLDEVTKLVCDYVNAEFAKINTKSKMTVEMVHGGEPWVVSSALAFRRCKRADPDQCGFSLQADPNVRLSIWDSHESV